MTEVGGERTQDSHALDGRFAPMVGIPRSNAVSKKRQVASSSRALTCTARAPCPKVTTVLDEPSGDV
jgi:hypothetical protein